MSRSNPTRADAAGRRASPQRGFTLLEVEVALLVFAFLVVGFMKLVWHHEELATAGDRWCQNTPSYFMQVPDDDLERALGVPAELTSSNPGSYPSPPGAGVYDVSITDWSKTLIPASATCSVLMVANP